jgi:hypothetical protein
MKEISIIRADELNQISGGAAISFGNDNAGSGVTLQSSARLDEKNTELAGRR